jgi:hypothetical protein
MPSKYAITALERETAAVAEAGQGERNNRLNQAAFALGQLVGGDELDRAEVEAALIQAAAVAGIDEADALPTIESGLKAGAKKPRTAPAKTPGNSYSILRLAKSSRPKPRWTPDPVSPPPDPKWRTRAAALVEWAEGHLHRNPSALAWLATRGIDAATAQRFRLGWNPGEKGRDIYRPREAWGLPEEISPKTGKPKKLWLPVGLVIPMLDSGGNPHRIRFRQPEREPKYAILPGSSMGPLVAPARTWPTRGWCIVESELDAIMLAGIIAAAGLDVGTVALGSATRKPDAHLNALLAPALAILVALDFDQAGDDALRFWLDQYPRAQDWPPLVGKDPGEDYAAGEDLAAWIMAGLPPAMTFPTVCREETRQPDAKPKPEQSDKTSEPSGPPDYSTMPAAKLPSKPSDYWNEEHAAALEPGFHGVDLLERLLRKCVQGRLYAVANTGEGTGARGCIDCWNLRAPFRHCDLQATVGLLVNNNPSVLEFVHDLGGRYHPQDRFSSGSK